MQASILYWLFFYLKTIYIVEFFKRIELYKYFLIGAYLMKRVVITGLGTINSVGHCVEDSFKAVVAGECGIDTILTF